MSKFKLPKGKEQLGAYIRTPILTEFRKFIVKKYGKYKGGLLSLETETAIQLYMSEHKISTNSNIIVTPNPMPKLHIVKEQIKQYLNSKFGYTIFYQVHKGHVLDAIRNLRGLDNRTVNKWLFLLEKNGLIKFLGTNHVELI